jgi:hypothetical protein
MNRTAQTTPLEAFEKAKITGTIDISFRTATLLSDIARLSSNVDAIYDELAELYEGDTETQDGIYDRIYGAYAPMRKALADELAAFLMEHTISERAFNGL